MRPVVWTLMPATCVVTAYLRVAPTAIKNKLVPTVTRLDAGPGRRRPARTTVRQRGNLCWRKGHHPIVRREVPRRSRAPARPSPARTSERNLLLQALQHVVGARRPQSGAVVVAGRDRHGRGADRVG